MKHFVYSVIKMRSVLIIYSFNVTKHIEQFEKKKTRTANIERV